MLVRSCREYAFLQVSLLLATTRSCASVDFKSMNWHKFESNWIDTQFDRVEKTEYYRMPSLYMMDNYEECMSHPGGTYCVADYDLFTTDHSDLMNFIQEYSAYDLKHFNHTQIHRATCVTITCKEYLKNTLNKSDNQESVLEACVNDSVWNSHKLQARLSKIQYCKKANDTNSLDSGDFIVASIYVTLIMLNIIGSLYDIILCEKDSKTGNSYLLAFSLRRNWTKLVVPAGRGPDPRLERLKQFNGLRAMTMVCVIFSHSSLVMTHTYIANPHYFEKTYDDPLKQLIFNGTLVTLTFFVMSSFLLAYNLQIQAEKHELTWVLIPKAILLRWIRLTPTYTLVIATISTWMRHLGDGPIWDLIVTKEINYCRQNWWKNLLYINNYDYKDNLCFPQAWYLAADTQLFCLGVVFLVIIQKPFYRKVALSLLFITSLFVVAAHTYFQDLNAVVLQSPKAFLALYANDATFTDVYIGGHTNIPTYTLGLAGGLLTYYWQTNEKDFAKYKKYRWLFWLVFPMGVAIILSGNIFYIDGVTPTVFLKVLYATLYKPFFQILIVIFIIGVVFKLETLYRGIVEWRGFTWAGRVSYSAFLLHCVLQRGYAGGQTTVVGMSDYFLLTLLSASTFLSFLLGALLWLLVEAPVAGLIRALLAPSNKQSS